jgi:hypothetical protein
VKILSLHREVAFSSYQVLDEWKKPEFDAKLRAVLHGFRARMICAQFLFLYTIRCIDPRRVGRRVFKTLKIFTQGQNIFCSLTRISLVVVVNVCLVFLRVVGSLLGAVIPELVFGKGSLHKAIIWAVALEKAQKSLKIENGFIELSRLIVDQRVRWRSAQYLQEKLSDSSAKIDEFLNQAVSEVYDSLSEEEDPLYDRFQKVFITELKEAVISLYERKTYTKEEIEDSHTALFPAFQIALLGTIFDSFIVSKDKELNFTDRYGCFPVNKNSRGKFSRFFDIILAIRTKVESLPDGQKKLLCEYIACRNNEEFIVPGAIKECFILIGNAIHNGILSTISMHNPKGCADAFQVK